MPGNGASRSAITVLGTVSGLGAVAAFGAVIGISTITGLAMAKALDTVADLDAVGDCAAVTGLRVDILTIVGLGTIAGFTVPRLKTIIRSVPVAGLGGLAGLVHRPDVSGLSGPSAVHS